MSQQYDVVAKNKHQNCRHDRNVVRIKESHEYTVLLDGWPYLRGPVSVLSECLIDEMGAKEADKFCSNI